jgi:hypothetical protein
MLNSTLNNLLTIPQYWPNVLAQVDQGQGNPIVLFLVIAVVYVFVGFTCQKIFEKCNVENAWFAWIPILNNYANFQAGDEEQALLWTLLMLVPCVNIVALFKLIIAWINICKKLGKSPWLLLIWLIPLGQLVFLGYLAFT